VTACPWCAGACAGADLGPLLDHDLAWLWAQLAARADRVGDPDLTSGTVTVTAPQEAAARHAAVGLLGGLLRAGQRRRVDLAALTDRLIARGPRLTPGAVAAHAVERRLGVRVAALQRLTTLLDHLRTRLAAVVADLPPHLAVLAGPDPVGRLVRSGALARLAAAPDPDGVVDQAAAVLTRLPAPPGRVDRRTLVDADPHALDTGPVSALVLAVTARAAVRPARAAWDQLGVDIDTITGGLLVTGIYPTGWQLSTGAVITVPPAELAKATWPPPAGAGQVNVTENPSVMQAAVDSHPGVVMVCLNGTPSKLVLDTLGALDRAGWAVRVRADFDVRGVQHVAAVLGACPGATTWRMRAGDYLAHLPDNGQPFSAPLPPTPWDPELHQAMTAHQVPVYEEDLLGELLTDLP